MGGGGFVRRARLGQTLERCPAVATAVFGLGRTMLFESEACAKGTALVADAREDAMRGPRTQRTTRGGSSGGRAGVVSNDRSGKSSRDDARLLRPIAEEIAEKNPMSGAQHCEVLREIARGRRRQSRRNDRGGIGRGWVAGAHGELALRTDAACGLKR